MGLLDGKRGLVFGIANDRSIACYIANQLIREGASCAFPHLPGPKNERRTRKALESIGVADPVLMACDVSQDEDLDRVFEQTRGKFDTIDFLVHSVAYADRTFLKPGNFSTTSREAFSQALDISAYSLVAMVDRAKEIMPNGGSVIAMTYYGSEKVVPGYNVMGVAKAALECTCRYLAADLGVSGIRVNCVSAGPIRTLSAMAVGGIDDMFDWVAKKSPLQRNIEAEEVAKTSVYLLSDLASGVTGETHFVDAGYNTIGL